MGSVLKEFGYISEDLSAVKGRELGLAVAEGLRAFSRAISCPTTLGELEKFTESHIERALEAAKNPQLKMKLQNMPVPLTAELVDEYMAPILQAAKAEISPLLKVFRPEFSA